MRKQSNFGINAGGITMLVIMVLLCLAIFGALSIASVRADLRLAEKMRTSAVNYYAADAEAQEVILGVAGIVEKYGGEADFAAKLSSAEDWADFDKWGLECGVSGDCAVVGFEVRVNELQRLCVTITLEPGGSLSVSEYMVKRYGDENYGEKYLDPWDGNGVFTGE